MTRKLLSLLYLPFMLFETNYYESQYIPNFVGSGHNNRISTACMNNKITRNRIRNKISRTSRKNNQ